MRRFRFRQGEISRLGGIFWRRSGPEARACWNEKAAYLNSLHPDGVFVRVPRGIKDFMTSALRSVTAELTELAKCFRSALLRAPSKGSNSCVRSFGPERFIFRTQSFRSFSISLLLQEMIFGEGLRRLKKSEVVYKRKKTAVVHIRTAKRLQDLFSVRGICPVLIKERDLIYSMNPKVFFKNNTVGFVVDDDPARRRWRVKTAANLVIEINSIPCLPTDLSYRYSGSEISEYWPIRIQLQGTKMAMTFSRVVCSVNNEGTDSRIIQS